MVLDQLNVEKFVASTPNSVKINSIKKKNNRDVTSLN